MILEMDFLIVFDVEVISGATGHIEFNFRAGLKCFVNTSISIGTDPDHAVSQEDASYQVHSEGGPPPMATALI